MKAIEIPEYGPPSVLRLTDRPRPEPEGGGVLIRVAAAGINRADIIQRLGKYPPPPGVTDIPGLEVAGEIVESRSPEWSEGDRVCALLAGGGYAEYVAVPAGQCLAVPETLDLQDAAALPEVVFTVWANIFGHGALEKGERVLIHGGSSGIGTMAIQMVRAWEGEALITAGTDEKCAACRELGAVRTINYKTGDFVAAVADYTAGAGVDVVLDMVGGDYVNRNLKCLSPRGRHVNIAHIGGRQAEIDIRRIMMKQLTLTGSTLRARPVADKTALRDAIRDKIWPLVTNGTINPVIFRRYSFGNAVAAHEELEAGHHIGKLILTL